MELVTDHVVRALDRLAQEYREKPRLAGVLSAAADQVQEAEQAGWQLYGVTIANASGPTLDILGALVGQGRDGFGDEDYRNHITARIAVNRSSGSVSDVKRAMVSLGATVTVKEWFPAEFEVLVATQLSSAVSGVALKFLRLLKAGGIRAILVWFEVPADEVFRWDTADQGWDEGYWGTAAE